MNGIVYFKFSEENFKSTEKRDVSFVAVQLKILDEIDLEEFTKLLIERHTMDKDKRSLPEGDYYDYLRENCTLHIDTTSNSYFVFDNKFNEVMDVSPEIFVSSIGGKAVNPNLARASKLPYDPYNFYVAKTEVDEKKGYAIPIINTHKFPAWRYLEVKDYNEKLLAPVFTFLDHLFPEAEAQEYVLNWMRHMVYGRAATVLCLNSNKGTGKNLFVDLCGYLVGEENYKKAPPKFLESSFNSVIEKTRLLFFDEQPMVTHEHEDNLKKLCNRTQTVHKKGKDANDTIEIYYSMILANNREIDLRLSFDDRRFSVPEITNVPLNKVWSEEQIIGFNELIQDDEVLAHFAKYLDVECDFGFGSEKPWKGTKFKRICDMSMFEYERFLFDRLANLVVNEGVFEISFDDLSFEYKEQYRKPLSFKILAEFLKKRYQGEVFAKLLSKGKSHKIVVESNMVEKFKSYLKEVCDVGDEALEETKKVTKGDRL